MDKDGKKKEGGKTLMIGGTQKNRLHCHCISDKKSRNHYDLKLDDVKSI